MLTEQRVHPDVWDDAYQEAQIAVWATHRKIHEGTVTPHDTKQYVNAAARQAIRKTVERGSVRMTGSTGRRGVPDAYNTPLVRTDNTGDDGEPREYDPMHSGPSVEDIVVDRDTLRRAIAVLDDSEKKVITDRFWYGETYNYRKLRNALDKMRTEVADNGL